MLHEGDCLPWLRSLPSDSVDACVTDPPYGLSFMGKTWDHGLPDAAVWREVLRVLKPGSHIAAFGGTRTFHRLACHIEDAGFDMRDTLMWLYGTGFPKSHDVSKGIDKALGAKGGFGGPKSAAHAGWIERGRMRGDDNEEGWQRPWMADPEAVGNAARQYLPGSPEAAQWQGWGTALKPAWEPIILARKPLTGTVAANVLAHGTGGLNIDGCRVPFASPEDAAGAFPGGRLTSHGKGCLAGPGVAQEAERSEFESTRSDAGRWPANVVHDGSDDVEQAFAAFGERPSGSGNKNTSNRDNGKTMGHGLGAGRGAGVGGDTGTASRFFYTAKASKADRAGSKHPTVKPVALMRWLTRLVCPRGGTVLDPFAGSGTTLQAAHEEGFYWMAAEMTPEYQADIWRRMMPLMLS